MNGFETIVDSFNGSGSGTIAVAAAGDDAVLKAVSHAYERGVAKAILCGNKHEIESIAEENSIDISSFEIISTENNIEAAKAAVALVREGKANMLMKGLIQTADLLRVVLNKESGLRDESSQRKDMMLSHVSFIWSTYLKRMLLLTDAAMIPYPGLNEKVIIIENAVQAAKGLGIYNPKVAILAAVEVVNPKMPATVDAAELKEMNQRGEIRDCIVDGPLAMDLIISKEAARHKKVVSPVAGEADIIVFPNIEAGNAVAKTFTNATDSSFAGVVMGASVPIVLTSRSDSDQSKLYSIAVAAKI